jgi:hypothetical protein
MIGGTWDLYCVERLDTIWIKLSFALVYFICVALRCDVSCCLAAARLVYHGLKLVKTHVFLSILLGADGN